MNVELFFDHYLNFLSTKTKIYKKKIKKKKKKKKKKTFNLVNLDRLEALKRHAPDT